MAEWEKACKELKVGMQLLAAKRGLNDTFYLWLMFSDQGPLLNYSFILRW